MYITFADYLAEISSRP